MLHQNVPVIAGNLHSQKGDSLQHLKSGKALQHQEQTHVHNGRQAVTFGQRYTLGSL